MQVASSLSTPFRPLRAATKPLATSQKPPHSSLRAEPVQATQKTSGIWEKRHFSLLDFIDAINPLQHIPIISTIYRKLTGDEMGYASRIAGDTLYSGIFGSFISGLVSAVANVFVDQTTGKDIGEHLVAALESKPASPSHTFVKQTKPSTEKKQVTMNQPIAVTTASAPAPEQTIDAPFMNRNTVQTAIDQYKWQMFSEQKRQQTDHWA